MAQIFLMYILKFGIQKLGIYEDINQKCVKKLTKCGNHTQENISSLHQVTRPSGDRATEGDYYNYIATGMAYYSDYLNSMGTIC